MRSTRDLISVFFAVLLTGVSTVAFGQASSSKSFEISPAKMEVEVGQKVQFSLKNGDGQPSKEKNITWFATPFDLASVDENGLVSFFQPGQVTLGALVNGSPVYTTVRVKPASVKTVEIDPVKTPLIVGGTLKLTAIARVLNGDPRNDARIHWTSETPAIATIDDAGMASGLGSGKATFKAASDNATATVAVNVVKASLRGLKLQPRTTNARTGDVIHFNALADGSSDSYAPRWAASGPAATIDSDGAFVAELPGDYVVTATIGDHVATASVLVAPRNVEREVTVVGRALLKDLQGAEEWIIGNYAYFSTIADRFLVYDISDPANPKLTDIVKVDARIVNDITTTADGKILVISREGASNRKNGIAFFDATDPAHPKLISEYTDTVTGGVHSAFVDGHYVYLTDDATGSMRVIDFSDVKNPKQVARWQVESPVATAVMKTNDGERVSGRYLHDVYVKDGLAYLAYWRDGLIILDVGNGMKRGTPENPQFVSQFRFNHNELYGDGWLAGAHAVYRYKNYVFVGDEVFPGNFKISSKERIPVRGIVHVIDVSEISQPRKVAEYAVPEAGSHNIWVDKDVLYMGYYTGGGRVLDVSGELRGDLYRQGREIARLWTGDSDAARPNLPFAWGAQPFKDMIFFNDVNSGLWIVKLGEAVTKGSTTTPGR
jgi:plastocyanin